MPICVCQPTPHGPSMRTSLSRIPLWQLTTQQSHVCYATATKSATRRRKKQTTVIPAGDTADVDPISSTKQSQATPPANVAAAFGEPPSRLIFDQTKQWVVFSDLHVSPKTINTSVEVLQYVHQQARDRKAGVLFLGDFWDRRGDLPVIPLNRIQDEISSWDMPLLLLPGNHDQVDLGGLDHSLEPIRVAAQHAHVFTTPTVYRDALWLPYGRREAEVKDAINQALQQQPIKAIFGHADVLTAHMNASYQAKDGLPPELFPPSVPVYLGHYHYPHTVAGTNITYIGSPYQVSRSEAGQQKRLLLLDHDWQITSEIPLNIGRKFWNFHTQLPGSTDSSSSSSSSGDESSSITDIEGALDPAVVAAAAVGEVVGSNPAAAAHFLLQPESIRALMDQGDLRPGDVAHLKYKEETEQLVQVQKMLAKKGVQVELHPHPKARPVARIASAEQLTMQQLMEQYAATTAMQDDVLQCARHALKELGSRSSETPHHSHLQLDSVTVEGFGPFKGAVDYPLANRGVVAVTGRNEDDTAAVSNGAGKTSLLTSLLWAFKVGDGRDMVTADYVNEDSKRATVTVRGSINQEPFELVRSTTGGARPKGSLSLTVAGEELTGQEQRLTETTLKDMFSTTLLPKTLVFTQEDLLGLLQSNDAAFKGMLSSVVDTASWEEAKQIAQEHKSQLEGQLSKLGVLAQQCQQNIGRAAADLEWQQQQQREWEQQQQQRQEDATHAEEVSLQAVHSTAQGIQALQQQLAAALAAAAAQQQSLEVAAAKAQTAAAAAAQQLQQQQQEDRAALDSVSSSSSAQELLPLVLPEYDDVAAAAALQPLEDDVVRLKEIVRQQQAAINEQQGQLKAAKQRQLKYMKLQGHMHSAGITLSSSSSSEQEAAAAAAVQGLRPVCEQCLQPINPELYQKNLENMAADEQQMQQELDSLKHGQQQQADSLAAAQQQYQELWQQQQEEKRRVQAERERLRSDQAAAARAAQQEAQQALQQQRQQYQQQQRQQQQLFDSANQLQRELSRLQQLTTSFRSLSSQLHDLLIYISNKLQLPDPLSSSSSSSANPAAAAAAAAAAEIDPLALEPQLRKETSRLSAGLTAAGDAVVQARGVLGQLAAAQNPYLSGVAQAQRTLEEQRQRLQDSEQQTGELSQQVNLWKRVYVAFGRTGIPSFLTEGALTELQAACSRHLSQLAAGMSLELSATSVKKTASKKPFAKKAAAAASSAAKKRTATAAAAAAAATAAVSSDNIDILPTATSAASDPDTPDPDLDASLMDADVADTPATDSLDLDADVAAADLKEEISKVVRVRSAGGELRQRSVAQLSGGEKKRVALALGLGFAELVAARSRLTSNVLILDEVLEKLDDEGCVCVAQLLKTLPYSSVFVVGQAGSFVTKEFAAVDTVVKSGGCATVELGGARP